MNKTINATFVGLIGLVLMGGGAYIRANESEYGSRMTTNDIPWFETSSVEYGWAGEELPAAVIISEEYALPEGEVQLQ